ncbi:MAG TPA: GntR family transcriptional regulator, partial [Candidatus Eisenbacteria bacterium]|nr:GntR family transcriptional regulator [Candidatus Eisenbacteria bacterium]
AFHRLFSGSRPGGAATASEEQSEKKHRSIARLVVEQLRSGILAGMLAPGRVIRADELAERLKLGRFALSNALRLLEAEGYVTFLADGEIAISSPKSREIEDYYAIAGVLEGLATRLAIERATNEETLRLRELHQALREAHRSGDAYAYFTANGKFHAFIVEMARNEPLARLIGEARHEIQKSSILALDLRERLDFSMREHDQILDTVLKRNRDLAQVIVSRHLENQMRALRQVLPPDPEVRHEGV